MIKKAKRKERKDGNIDFEIEHRHFKIKFFSYYSLIEWIADVMIGSFFILGSVLNFFGVEALYSYLCYLIGSLSMTVRPTIKVIKHIKIRKKKEDEES